MEIRTGNAWFGIKDWNFGSILVNKVLQKWQKTKSVNNISCAPDLIFFNEKKIGSIQVIFT